MSQINFPENPTLNELYEYNGRVWEWNGFAWDFMGSKDRFERYVSHTFSHGTIDPTDGTQYSFGNISDHFPLTGFPEEAKIICLYEGKIVSYSVFSHPGSVGSSESSTYEIINETKDESIEYQLSHDNTYLQEVSLSEDKMMNVSVGDVLTIKWTTPIWDNNPLQVRSRVEIKIKLKNA